jgi:hypothetical protein
MGVAEVDGFPVMVRLPVPQASDEIVLLETPPRRLD